MILITNIDYIETEKDYIEIEHMHYKYDIAEARNKKGEIVPLSISEVIKGRKFITPEGKEVVIGMSKEVSDIINIYYDSWYKMENELISKNKTIKKLKNKISLIESQRNYLSEALENRINDIKKLRCTKLLTRIKWIFTGIK